MSFTDAKTYLELPAPVVNQGGYLGHANVVPAGPHDLMGAEYITDACAEGARWTDLCYNADQTPCDEGVVPPPAGGYKTFGQPELVSGSPFAVYDGVDCDLMGLEESRERAVNRLSYSEGRQVDHHVTDTLALQVSQDLGAQSLTAAIAQFEDWAGELYGSYGVISLPRSEAILARSLDLVEPSPTGGLQTALGTQVIAVAKQNPVGTSTAYLTGRITLIQGSVQAHTVSGVTRPDGSCDPQRALAERMYVPLVECMVVSATVTGV